MPGFDFLGFNIKQFKTGKYTTGKDRGGNLLGFKTIIKPSKESLRKHYKKLVNIIEKCKGLSQTLLISKLNPIIRGWCNYFSSVTSQKTFDRMTHQLYWKLFRWGIRRHRNKGKKWIKNKYFKKIGGKNWAFADINLYQLRTHSETKITRFVKVKGDVSPYNGDLIYWSSRMGRHLEMPTRTAFLLKKQKEKCNMCELTFREKDVIETDHIISIATGGKDEYKNLQLLHGHCHDKKTKSDLEAINKYQREKRITKFYKWFNKLNWIWKEDIPTMI